MALSADSPVPLIATQPPEIGVASLYQEIILSHYRAPKHKGEIRGANPTVERESDSARIRTRPGLAVRHLDRRQSATFDPKTLHFAS